MSNPIPLLPSIPPRLALCTLATGLLLVSTAPAGPCLPVQGGPAKAQGADEAGFEPLFDGETLAGWVNYKTLKPSENWGVEDGALTRMSGGGDLVTAVPYDHFDFRFEWRISEGGNSGVMYKVKAGDPEAYLSGPEYQVFDDRAAGLDDRSTTASGALYGLIAAEGKELRPVAEFNTGRIVLHGNHLEHWLNGKKVVDIDIHGERWNELVGASKFKAWEQFAQSPIGHIALQDHGNKVWYRNLRLRPLAPPEPEDGAFADITPGSSQALIDERLGGEDFVLLDVRTQKEVDAGHLEGMQTLDYFAKDFRDQIDALDKDRTYLVYCRSGRRSGETLKIMQELGFREAYNMYGGWLRWTAEKRPTDK